MLVNFAKPERWFRNISVFWLVFCDWKFWCNQKSGSIRNHRNCSTFTWYLWFSPIPPSFPAIATTSVLGGFLSRTFDTECWMLQWWIAFEGVWTVSVILSSKKSSERVSLKETSTTNLENRLPISQACISGGLSLGATHPSNTWKTSELHYSESIV